MRRKTASPQPATGYGDRAPHHGHSTPAERLIRTVGRGASKQKTGTIHHQSWTLGAVVTSYTVGLPNDSRDIGNTSLLCDKAAKPIATRAKSPASNRASVSGSGIGDTLALLDVELGAVPAWASDCWLVSDVARANVPFPHPTSSFVRLIMGVCLGASSVSCRVVNHRPQSAEERTRSRGRDYASRSAHYRRGEAQ